MRNMRKNKRRAKGESGNDLGECRVRQAPAMPPQREANVVLRHVWRYRTDGVNTDITALNLCCVQSVGTTLNTSVSGLFKAVRIRSIKIWLRAPTTLAGTSTGVPSASVTWTQSSTSGWYPNSELSATAMSNSTPTVLFAKPPARSLASDWVVWNTGNVFLLKAPQGSIIDIDLEHVLLDGESGPTTNAGTVAIGYFYAMPLDGSSDACQPVGLVTTT
jgi:hypothetical protein